MIDDLRHFRAPRPVNPWHCLAFAACMFVISSVDAAPMPPAEPIFEKRADLRRLTIPVPCSGKSHHGIWIRHGERTNRPLPMAKCV